MKNDRPVENPELQSALDEVKEVFARHGFAGAVMMVAPQESAFFYAMHAPWSAIQPDNTTNLGFRIRAIAAEHGPKLAHRRIEGAMHTICSLHDFGSQTVMWMTDLENTMRRSGIDFEHTPFGGKRPERLTTEKPRA